MSNLDVEIFKTRLLELQLELEELYTISKSAAATVVLDQSCVGRLSRMDALQGQQMALEAERRRKQQLLQIKAALIRIERDDFGYCASCGEEIGSGRLAISPMAIHCVSCSE